MRLDSVFKKSNVNRIDVLNYVKNKHHLYFVGGKIKDAQLLKFIDKIISRNSKGKTNLTLIKEEVPVTAKNVQVVAQEEEDDFDYLNDDE